jgi:uncharacterized protein (DUF2336 family)
VETDALAELGAKLAPIDNAPSGIIHTLARHDEIAVAGPVLAHSTQLTDNDLVEIAGSKSQDHLGAISERKRLATAVTDILIQRGDTRVVRKLSQNEGATFWMAATSGWPSEPRLTNGSRKISACGETCRRNCCRTSC